MRLFLDLLENVCKLEKRDNWIGRNQTVVVISYEMTNRKNVATHARTPNNVHIMWYVETLILSRDRSRTVSVVVLHMGATSVNVTRLFAVRFSKRLWNNSDSIISGNTYVYISRYARTSDGPRRTLRVPITV